MMSKKKFILKDIQKFRKQGIYSLFKEDKLVYIGISKNVYTRILEHCFEDVKDFDSFKSNEQLNELNYTDLELVEVLLILNNKPKYNKLVINDAFVFYNTLPSEIRNNKERSFKILLEISKMWQDYLIKKG